MKNLIKIIAILGFGTTVAVSQQSDAALRTVVEKDKTSRESSGPLVTTLSAAEHLYRGDVYFTNRLFPQARDHFQRIIDVYPTDAGVPSALFGIGRSYMWERECTKAIPFLDRVSREYPNTKNGREGLAFKAACHIRLGKSATAAKIYEQYTVMYPAGERIDSAYLNLIDALREAGDYDGAGVWVRKTRQRFAGQPTETNALHALLRLQIHKGRWTDAESTANTLLSQAKFTGSITSVDEVRFLRSFAMEKAGKKQQAMDSYALIPNVYGSYYGGLAAERLARNGAKFKVSPALTAKQLSDHPVAFRTEVLRYSKKHKIDPRFILAIMKQESAFKAGAKSPSAARGLLQLVFDTALKYNNDAGFPDLKPDDLYDPVANIAIACEYIAALKDEFGGLYEAIAASYNGGEDNVARWLNRTKPKEAGIFTSEIGFAESKNYVFKVMSNYRIYRELYDDNLVRKG
ncbi:MAG: transglycosylase SLT domain-containing protein [Pyrinomonadaceae bacterium]